MNLTRSAVTASVATVVLWTAKAVAIGVAGGLGKSPLEGPLFMLGLLSCVVAAVLVGAAAFARRTVGWRVLGAVLCLVVAAVVCTLSQALVDALRPTHPGWVYGEVNLWVTMLALLAGALWLRAREVSASRGTSLGARAPRFARRRAVGHSATLSEGLAEGLRPGGSLH